MQKQDSCLIISEDKSMTDGKTICLKWITEIKYPLLAQASHGWHLWIRSFLLLMSPMGRKHGTDSHVSCVLKRLHN